MGDLLPVATARSSLTTLAIMAYSAICHKMQQKQWSGELTIRVVVITLAMPSPCGTMSSHKCHEGVLSLQVATIDAATTVIAADRSVSV